MAAVSSMPNWQGFLVPILRMLSDGKQRSRRELFLIVPGQAGLSDDQLAERLASGGERAVNRVGWALSALAQAGAVGRPSRAQYVITDVGRGLLGRHPNGLTRKDLLEIPEYRDYVPVVRRMPGETVGTADDFDSELDPIEQIDRGITRLQAEVAADLLKRLREQDPDFLERSVLDVLVKMGYGGTEGAAQHIGGPGDEGIDGVIDQDPLGLERIYVQAKRYAADHPVGREAIQAFVGALQGRNVNRGVFITTSRFSAGASQYASSIGSRVILIDGDRLAALMISYGVGVDTKKTYATVEIDEDYFE